METKEEAPNLKPKYTLNARTRGHKRMIGRLGGPAAAFLKEEEWAKLSDEEKKEGTLVLIWLYHLPLEDLVPGGKIDAALKVDGGWKRYFHAWEFTVEDSDMEGLVAELNRILA